jgi:hypothetical protein
MANLTVDLTNKASMQLALTLIGMLMSGATPVNVTDSLVEEQGDVLKTSDDMDLGMDMITDTATDGGGLDDLLNEPEPEPEGVTVEAMKLALKGLITAKGKDVAIAEVRKAFEKLKVERMEDIVEAKREAFVTYLNGKAAK